VGQGVVSSRRRGVWPPAARPPSAAAGAAGRALAPVQRLGHP
jgi:hypothetical protein